MIQTSEVYVYVRVCVCVYTYTCIHMYIYIYIYIYESNRSLKVKYNSTLIIFKNIIYLGLGISLINWKNTCMLTTIIFAQTKEQLN